MGNAEDILREELEFLKQSIINNIDSTGKRASGRTQNGIRAEVSANGSDVVGTLYGRPFFGALETGSRPWRNQYKRVPKFFAEIIGDWIRDKGLDLNPYAVATNIMREGTHQFHEGPRTDVFTDATNQTLANLRKRLAGLYQMQIIESILR